MTGAPAAYPVRSVGSPPPVTAAEGGENKVGSEALSKWLLTGGGVARSATGGLGVSRGTGWTRGSGHHRRRAPVEVLAEETVVRGRQLLERILGSR